MGTSGTRLVARVLLGAALGPLLFGPAFGLLGPLTFLSIGLALGAVGGWYAHRAWAVPRALPGQRPRYGPRPAMPARVPRSRAHLPS